jgi:hypothetical protein
MISSVLSKQFGRLPTRALLTRCSSGMLARSVNIQEACRIESSALILLSRRFCNFYLLVHQGASLLRVTELLLQ